MSAEDKIEKIAKIDKLDKKDPVHDVAEDQVRQPPDKERFDKLIEEQQQKQSNRVDLAEQLDPGKKKSLMDEMRTLNSKVTKASKVSHSELIAEADHLVNQIESIKNRLKTPALSLHPSTQTLLQNKLSHIDENLRVALSKAGVEYNPNNNLNNKSVNPIERFLGFLSHGQSQLSSMSSELNTMSLNNKEISPGNMLRIQLKMGYITQEVQFFSAILNKALDSTKTIMNIQV